MNSLTSGLPGVQFGPYRALLLPPQSKGLPHVGDLRYQLLTACAGVVAEAERKGCFGAVMLVQEFGPRNEAGSRKVLAGGGGA